MREVWDKSDPAIKTQDDIMFTPTASATLLLGWWLPGWRPTILGRISWRLDPRGGDGRAELSWRGVDISPMSVAIIAAVLAIFVVRDIDRRQTERSRHVNYLPHMPPPPPLFTQPPRIRSRALKLMCSTHGRGARL